MHFDLFRLFRSITFKTLGRTRTLKNSNEDKVQFTTDKFSKVFIVNE